MADEGLWKDLSVSREEAEAFLSKRLVEIDRQNRNRAWWAQGLWNVQIRRLRAERDERLRRREYYLAVNRGTPLDERKERLLRIAREKAPCTGYSLCWSAIEDWREVRKWPRVDPAFAAALLPSLAPNSTWRRCFSHGG